MYKTEILGVRIDSLPLSALLEEIDQAVSSNRRMLIAHVNITALNLAYKLPWLRQFYNQADRVYCDGMGVMVGARLLGCSIQYRYTLADWVWPLAEMAARRGHTLFLLGNPPGAAQRAARRLQERYPALCIAGTQHGFFDKTPGSPESLRIVEHINAVNTDILLVGFGMPLQEQWLMDHEPILQAKATITCGALFEYVAGDLRRGPSWMTQNYMEWLARMLISPRRYAWRYMRDIPLFYWRILKEAFQPFHHRLPHTRQLEQPPKSPPWD
jgi:N-acetylglucosaminyldiphosphoundecaprenol N-acetyl-beta-D-mannosaminyltransferase